MTPQKESLEMASRDRRFNSGNMRLSKLIIHFPPCTSARREITNRREKARWRGCPALDGRVGHQG